MNFFDKPIWCARDPVDMRRSFKGLAAIVTEVLEKDPRDEALFLFFNKSCNYIKALYWAGNGFILVSRQLEKGAFRFPLALHVDDKSVRIEPEEFAKILHGLDLCRTKRRRLATPLLASSHVADSAKGKKHGLERAA